MNEISIFDYETYAKFFTAYVEYQKRTNKNFSYRYLCRKLGIKAPSLLNWIASGRRLPTPYILGKLCEHMKMSPEESSFAHALVHFATAKTPEEKVFFHNKLRDIRPRRDPVVGRDTVDEATWEQIAQWHVVSIMEMIALADFNPDPAWVAARLGGKVSEQEVAEAFRLLESVNLITRTENGYVRTIASLWAMMPSYVIRRYMSDFMGKAREAVFQQEPKERFISSGTFVIDSSRMPEFQEILTDMHKRFVKFAKTESGDQAYHFALQFFRITEELKPENEKSLDNAKPQAKKRAS